MTPASIHPTAIIDPRARLGAGVSVGAYSVIGGEVVIGDNTWIGPHVVLQGPMTLGARNQIFQFASIGEISQDKTATPEQPTRTTIGDDNIIREYVSIQRGTMKEWDKKQGQTIIGSRNLIMNYCHIAHDCVLGNDIIMANNASLAGHVEIGDFVGLGGYTLIYQFCRIGHHAFTAFSTGIKGDVPPFMMVEGNPGEVRTINKEGLRRRGFGRDEIESIDEAFKLIYRSGKIMAEVKQELVDMAQHAPRVAEISQFVQQGRRALQR
jgi:UDP-N-acetylglucosamine acyltransferase